MATKSPQDMVRKWREGEGLTQADLAARIGDESGQFQRWESGNRPTLPLKMRVRISLVSGIPISQLVDSEEAVLARELVAVLARDAAA